MKRNERKIIFSDFDGTLFNLEKEIVPEGTWEAFKRLKENGHITVLVTGRPEGSFKKYLTDDMRASFTYIATDNGTKLFEVIDDEDFKLHLLHVVLLPQELVKEVLKYRKENNISAVINCKEGIVQMGGETKYPENKIIWKDNLPVVEYAHEIIQINLDGCHDLAVEYQSNWQPKFTTYASEAGKAITVTHIKELHPNCTTFAFGDENNDINMFKTVDNAFAMHHATDELKKHATGILNEGYQVPEFLNKM